MPAFIILLLATLAFSHPAYGQRDKFISVSGSTLKDRLDSAIRQGRSSQAGYFWTAFSFDVRPGVAVDVSLTHFDGGISSFSGTSVLIGKSQGITIETPNLGIFLLNTKDGGKLTRIEIYNLDRPREYSGYPVYWLGRANNDESLSLLRSLLDNSGIPRGPERLSMAIGLHDDPRVIQLLRNLARGPGKEESKETAVFWLGHIGGQQQFLSDIVRDEKERFELRKRAVYAVGIPRDRNALAALIGLYPAVTETELRKRIVTSVASNESEEAAVEFLIKLAGSDPNTEVRKQALYALGRKAGERSLQVLGDAVSETGMDIEVQKSAVTAISRRERAEAIPLLIKIARTHPKAEVRKQAFQYLARSGDERALALFTEILSK